MSRATCLAAFCLIGSALFSGPATAGPAADALGVCLGDNTTGKDRKDLAQWIFVAMAAHPEIKPLSAVTEAGRDALDRKLAALATRLLTENCRAEAKAAVTESGNVAIESAFGVLGRLAMAEVMSNPAVSEAIVRYAKYLDQATFESVLK